jgi:SsrA-binding protein
MHVARYEQAKERQEERRPRKLLMHRREIDKLIGKTAEHGLTLIPMRLYFTHGIAKVELGLGKGKRKHEKRQAIAEREANREIERNVGRRR